MGCTSGVYSSLYTTEGRWFRGQLGASRKQPVTVLHQKRKNDSTIRSFYMVRNTARPQYSCSKVLRTYGPTVQEARALLEQLLRKHNLTELLNSLSGPSALTTSPSRRCKRRICAASL